MVKIVLNVSGHLFVTTSETLSRFPTTKLGRLASETGDGQERFFDADEDVFKEVLRYHRTGELHAPRNMCLETFRKELEFWNVDHEDIEYCCQNSDVSDSELEKQFQKFDKRILLERSPTTKDKIWYFLTDPIGPYTRYRKAAILWAVFYAVMVLAQSILLSIITLPQKVQQYSNSSSSSYLQLLKIYMYQPCTAIIQEGSADYRIEDYLHHVYPTFFILEVTVRLISCPHKRTFFCSINMLDLIISIAELIQVVLWVISNGVVDFRNADPQFCLFLNVTQIVMLGVVQLRCVRIFTIALIFRYGHIISIL